MRVLFTSTIGTGHLLPVLALARAAAAAGHLVRVATAATQAGRVAGAGLDFVELTQPSEAEYAAVRAEARGDDNAAVSTFFGRLRPLTALADVEAASDGVDLIVSESGEFAGFLAAERLGLPLVRLHPGMVLGGGWESIAADDVAGARREAGLATDDVVNRLFAVPQISYFPALLDARPTPGPVFRVRRPELPARSRGQQDLIYITFGTEVSGMPMFPDVARAAVEAVRMTGHEIVLSTGAARIGDLGDLSGVRADAWADESEVLPRAAAMISHGGAGTTLSALAAGVPMITVPFFADQPFNADTIQNAGAGVTVAPGPDLEDRLRDALAPLLADPPSGSPAVADAIASLPPIEEAVRLLESTASVGISSVGDRRSATSVSRSGRVPAAPGS